MPSSNDKKYPCQYDNCTKSFKRKQGLADHVTRCHLKVLRFKCDSCNKEFIRNYLLKRHIKQVHNKEDMTIQEGKVIFPYRCTVNKKCIRENLAFKTKGSLKLHVKRHEGIKDFICHFEDCGKGFVTKHELNVHLNHHTRKKPYRCRINKCTKKISDPSNRFWHEKNCDHSKIDSNDLNDDDNDGDIDNNDDKQQESMSENESDEIVV
jgi:uncharacterized Zn-finger protein